MVQKKAALKLKAITLRKRAFTYSEILKEVPVAKSTLSLWLQSVDLATKQAQRLTQKKLAAALRGGLARKSQRLELTTHIIQEAANQIKGLSFREFWLIGIALYWAEGSKEKSYKPGSGVNFNNSDPRMIRLFVDWLQHIVKVPKNTITFEIYIHTSASLRVLDIQRFWSKVTGFPIRHFQKVYFKKRSISTNRKNIGNLYYGVLRVKVKSSSKLNRQIAGWVEGISTLGDRLTVGQLPLKQ